MNWQPMETVPLDQPVLVKLESPLLGMTVHGAMFHRGSSTIGCIHGYDAPDPIGWMLPPNEEPDAR